MHQVFITTTKSKNYILIAKLRTAILKRKLADLQNIVENNPSLLDQNFADGEDSFSLATKTFLLSTQNDDKTKSVQILRKILNKKFTEIPPDCEKNLETLFLNKVLLEQLYAEKNTDVDFEIFKKAVLKTLVKSSSDNSFNKIYKQIFESINEVKEDKTKEFDQEKAIKDADNNSMFIYSSGLKNHQSYFIFHVDAQNKLTSISYCDGSSTEHSKIKGSSTHIHGVTTFALENSVEYSSDIAKSFIKNNCQGKTIDEFNKKLEDKTIQITEAKIDYKNTKYSIPTTAQKEKNYTSKNTSILARFVANKKDPKMIFELDKKTKKPKGKGYEEYKKFKENLIKEASKSTLKLQEETSKKSDNFSEYLKKEIEKTLDEVERNNKRKLSSGQSLPSKFSLFLNLFSAQRLPDPRKIFHQELSGILSQRIQKEPEKTPPIEELNITQELQKKFPDFFPPEKKLSNHFISSRSKSPSISLRENLTVKEKAIFIKTYHDLIENKYKEIQSHNAKEDLVAKGIKEQDLFKELKKLDEKIEELLVKDSRKLNDELYKLSPDNYPQATILGRNALASRKKSILIDKEKSSKALTGAEFFKFSVLSDLMEVERKIKDGKVKLKTTEQTEQPKTTEQPEQPKTIEEIEKGELVKTIQKIDESEEFKFSAEDLKIFLDLERNKLKDPSIKTSKEDPLLILKGVIDPGKDSLEKDAPKQDEKLFKNLLDLINKETERELNLKMELKRNAREQKKITIKFAFHLLSNPNNQKPEKILEDINSLKIENISEKDLMDFLKLSNCESITEKISTLENLKKTLETLKQPEPQKENNNTTKMLKAVGDYLTKMKKEETKLITEFQDKFNEKSNYEIINSLLEKIKKNDLELKIFCKALDKDPKLKFKIGDLKLFLNNLNDKDKKEEDLLKLEKTLKIESKINSGNLKILQDFIRENKEELLIQQPPTTTTSLFLGFVPENKKELLKQQPQTTTSLFLGFVPHNCSKFIPKEIKNLVKTPVRFGARLFEEMQKPDTNIFQAFHEVLLDIDKPKPKTK